VSHQSDSETKELRTKSPSLAVSGFTPIELLMTITLLGIVSAAVVPQMLSDSENSRQNTLLKRLHSVRGQIEQYKQNHAGELPGQGMNSAREFMNELAHGPNSEQGLAHSSNPQVETGFELPPLNPYTQRSGILVVPAGLKQHHYSGNGQHGWAYSSTTGEFRANLSPHITDRSGRLINQL